MNNLPVINISAVLGQASEAVTREIAMACHQAGFLCVTGHGIEANLISHLRQLLVEFFQQPLVLKQRFQVASDNYRGYIPFDFFTPNAAGQHADVYEGYKLHAQVDAADAICSESSLYGENSWPEQPAGLRNAVEIYWQQCDYIAQTLIMALLKQVGVDTAFVQGAFDKPLTNMTLLHYPATPKHDSTVGIHPHKDTDVLTILAPDAVGGLEIRPRSSKEWVAAVAPADGLIINIGDMLEQWSGGYYISTPHRVINRSGQDRYSFPYFAVPRHDVVVRPLCALQKGFVPIPMHCGEVSRKIWQSNWPDSPPVETCYDPAIT